MKQQAAVNFGNDVTVMVAGLSLPFCFVVMR